jgi:AbrB family looped-hinge helix DNA binding protein
MAPVAAAVRVGPQGRLVIPASLRQALDIHPGDVLIARTDNHQLIFEKREAILERVQSYFASVPADVQLADELIAERRAEARQEERQC